MRPIVAELAPRVCSVLVCRMMAIEDRLGTELARVPSLNPKDSKQLRCPQRNPRLRQESARRPGSFSRWPSVFQHANAASPSCYSPRAYGPIARTECSPRRDSVDEVLAETFRSRLGNAPMKLRSTGQPSRSPNRVVRNLRRRHHVCSASCMSRASVKRSCCVAVQSRDLTSRPIAARIWGRALLQECSC